MSQAQEWQTKFFTGWKEANQTLSGSMQGDLAGQWLGLAPDGRWWQSTARVPMEASPEEKESAMREAEKVLDALPGEGQV